MSAPSGFCWLLCCALCLGCVACADAPGHPAPGPEVPRPDQVRDFSTLYEQNCAGCHGTDGKNGAAVSLSDPLYLAFAGEAAIRQITANGVAGKLMPGFAKSAGGSLTDPQIDSLVHGIFQTWGNKNVVAGSPLPPYRAGEQADANRMENEGQKTFVEFCGRCHGSDGKGINGQKSKDSAAVAGSIVDPAYLALVSDQSLRSTIVAGRPELGMPGWRSDSPGPGGRAMSDREIASVVAWLAAQRAKYPGQPYISRE